MPRKSKAPLAELPAIPAELLEQFGDGPMTAEAIHAASQAFKKALIERALGAEVSHHLGSRSGDPYFLDLSGESDNPALVRVPHDCAGNGLYPLEQIEVVSASLSDFFDKATIC